MHFTPKLAPALISNKFRRPNVVVTQSGGKSWGDHLPTWAASQSYYTNPHLREATDVAAAKLHLCQNARC